MTLSIYTIGHSTHKLEEFVDLLKQHGISAICDVRSSPYSGFNPQFNREEFKEKLKVQGIKYVFLGEELGARSEDPACYQDGRVKYDRIAKTEKFNSGIERLKKGAEEYCIALMCAEKDPVECHRTILVARVLNEEGYDIVHILADGSTEKQKEAIDRMVGKYMGNNRDMFLSEEELRDQAFDSKERAIAYKLNDELSENQQMVGEN